MKSLLFAVFAFSLIFTVSAQCDVSAVQTCILNYSNMVSKLSVVKVCLIGFSMYLSASQLAACINTSSIIILCTRPGTVKTYHICYSFELTLSSSCSARILSTENSILDEPVA